MHSVLFVVSIPKFRQSPNGWDDFVTQIDVKLKDSTNFLRLAENVWLLNLQKDVAQLGWLVSHADKRGFAYGILPFERAPEWLPAGLNPKTIQGHSVPS